jgi:transcriptional regulator with XRE-family HTH domain
VTTDDPGRDIRVDADGLKLAERLRGEREYLNLKQEQVADVLRISRAAVSAIETGRRKVSGLLGAEPEEDETTQALFRTAKELSDQDRAQVLRFAEFLRNAGPPPQVLGDSLERP